MFIIAFAPAPVAATEEQSNSITIEIVRWSTDRCTYRCNVQFSISTDLDNDGSFDIVNTSQVINDVARVNEPLKANISIPSNQTTFAFKVEAFRVDGSSSDPLYYGRNESGIVHQGANILGFNSSWEYNYPRDQIANDSTCSLAYRYEVAGQGPNGAVTSSGDDPKPVGISASPLIDPLLLGAVGLLSAAGGAGAMKLANSRSDREVRSLRTTRTDPMPRTVLPVPAVITGCSRRATSAITAGPANPKKDELAGGIAPCGPVAAIQSSTMKEA